MSLYEKTEKFVLDSFKDKTPPDIIRHFLRTVYWVEFLKPKADEA